MSRRPRHHTRGGSSSSQPRSGSPHDDSHHSGDHMISPFAGQDHPATSATTSVGSTTAALVTIYRTAKGQADFSSGLTSDAIRECMLARINGFWPTYSDIPNDVKRLMFTDFVKKFTWDPDVSDQEVIKIWRRKASIKYREWTYEMRKKGQRHTSCPEEVYERFLVYWDTPEFKASSEKASASRKANPKLHTGGSRSYADYRMDMMGEGQEEPTAWQVYSKTHKVESSEEEPTASGWIDHVSEQFATDFDAERKRLESEGFEISRDVEEHIFQTLAEKQTRRRDRIPNVGNIPKKGVRNRASSSSSSVNQGNEDELSWKARFDVLEKDLQLMKKLYTSQQQQQPPPE